MAESSTEKVPRNMKTQNMGVRWLRNGGEGGHAWGPEAEKEQNSTTMQGGDRAEARFMEMDGRVNEVSGDNGGIRVVQRHQGSNSKNNSILNQGENITVEQEITIIDPKRRRVDNADKTEGDSMENTNGPTTKDGSLNLPNAGPVIQARLDQ